jgi:hypothetical protein
MTSKPDRTFVHYDVFEGYWATRRYGYRGKASPSNGHHHSMNTHSLCNLFTQKKFTGSVPPHSSSLLMSLGQSLSRLNLGPKYTGCKQHRKVPGSLDIMVTYLGLDILC